MIQGKSDCLLGDQEGIFSPAVANWSMLYWGFLPSSGSTVGIKLGILDCTIFFILFIVFKVELDGLVSFFNLTNYVTM